jgi:hypothetical protein
MTEPNGDKGAVPALTYSLAQSLSHRRIPGRVESFGGHRPFGRAAQSDEIARYYVFFTAGQPSSYYSGEVLAPIGGETLPG